MLLWILFVLLAAAVATLLLRAPSAAGRDANHDPDLAVYRDQLSELAADSGRGVIDAEQAASARTEIARRLLKQAATKPAALPHQLSPASRLSTTLTPERVLLGACALIPVASLALYLTVGSPSMPGRPLESRLAEAPDAAVPNDMIAKVEAHLREKPDDGQGWAVIAPVYLAQGRAPDAALAFARAIQLVGETPERLSGLAKANLMASNGIVNEPARKAYARLLELDPKRIEAEYWLAVFDEQNGRPEIAAATYVRLLASAPADAPWRKVVEERLAAVGQKSAAPAGPAAPAISPPQLSSAAGTGPKNGPTPAEFVAAAQNLAPEMRELMIGRMIAKATDAVSQNPKDVSAWSRIVTGHKALGKPAEAQGTLKQAREALTADAPGLTELDALAKSLGLTS